MSDLSECQGCQNYSRSLYLPCAMHPQGSARDCPDFKRQPYNDRVEFWEPEGASFYGDELIITSVNRWIRIQRLELLSCHPIFTGVCPDCQHQFSQENLSHIHLDCPVCGWADDSL
jgi:hypothetical protein